MYILFYSLFVFFTIFISIKARIKAEGYCSIDYFLLIVFLSWIPIFNFVWLFVNIGYINSEFLEKPLFKGKKDENHRET